ncbi:hypothetical protein Pfo_018612 [Paulownia fortunei]|nr:hypothetical protein Pfo_018612 [Paulownia fortunei]
MLPMYRYYSDIIFIMVMRIPFPATSENTIRSLFLIIIVKPQQSRREIFLLIIFWGLEAKTVTSQLTSYFLQGLHLEEQELQKGEGREHMEPKTRCLTRLTKY